VNQSQARSFHKTGKRIPHVQAGKKIKTELKPDASRSPPKLVKPPNLSLKVAVPAVVDSSPRDQFGINSPRTIDGDHVQQDESPTVKKEEIDSDSKVPPLTPDQSASDTTKAAESVPEPASASVAVAAAAAAAVPASVPIQESGPKLTAPWRTNHLLPPVVESKKGKKCLILDLDETLVHSSFQPVECDFKIPVDIEGIVRTIYVSKRPLVDDFMKACGDLFEVVVFTASLAKYADPLLDLLDIHNVIDHRLFRESCTPHCGTYVKDLFRMGRPLSQLIIIDNSPHSYAFNPQNAIPCESWFDDRNDQELNDILVILQRLADPKVPDVMVELEVLEVSGLGVGLMPVGVEGESGSEGDGEVEGGENEGEGGEIQNKKDM